MTEINAFDRHREFISARVRERGRELSRVTADLESLHATERRIGDAEPTHLQSMERWMQRGTVSVVTAGADGLWMIKFGVTPLALAATVVGGVAAIVSLTMQMRAGSRVQRGRSEQCSLFYQEKGLKESQGALRAEIEGLRREMETTRVVEAVSQPDPTATVCQQDGQLRIGALRIPVRSPNRRISMFC